MLVYAPSCHADVLIELRTAKTRPVDDMLQICRAGSGHYAEGVLPGRHVGGAHRRFVGRRSFRSAAVEARVGARSERSSCSPRRCRRFASADRAFVGTT